MKFDNGISSRNLFWRFPSLKKKLWAGHLWSRGKFFRSFGSVASERVEYYIKESQLGGLFSKTGQTSIENFTVKTIK
jgi:putative transposase